MMETTSESTEKPGTGWAEVAAASAEAEKAAPPKAKPPRNFKQVLPVKLSDLDKAKLAEQVAALDLKRDEQEAAKKQATDKAKAEIELTETQIKELLAAYRKGAVDREVECVEEFLFETNTAKITRCDTNEVISTRALTTAERQVSMFEPEKKAAAAEDASPEDAGEDEVVVADGKTTTKKSRRSKG